MSDPADAKEFARPLVEAAGLHWPTFERQIQTESGWQHWSSPGVVKSSPTGSMGLGQLNAKFYPESDWRDPYTNLAKSIEIMSGYLTKFGSYRKALAAYNWGPANVAGYTKSGLTHPAWDGTREWRCPHADIVASCRTAQRDHYLDLILGPGWPEPTEAPVSGIVYEDFRDPAPAGRFTSVPKGVILHGSRSGKAGNPLDQEYLGTARYEQNNDDGLGWHATIGERKVAVHLTPYEWGWNARSASSHYIAVEIAQPTVDSEITDAQVAALADYLKTRIFPIWGNLGFHFPTHAELEAWGETGQKDGKTDIYPLGDERVDSVRNRLYALLGAPGWEQPEPPPPSPLDLRAEIKAILDANSAAAIEDLRTRLTELLDRTA